MNLYKEKFRIDSTRLKDWDYSSDGYYFVTICVKDKKPVFGDVVDGKAILSKIGETAERYWLEIPSHFKDVGLDECIVMPNHIHGIIIINEDEVVVAHGRAPVPRGGEDKILQRKAHSILSFIAGFKSAATMRINVVRATRRKPVWHRNYYEHIIRSEKPLEGIREYIANNPIKWELDEYHPGK